MVSIKLDQILTAVESMKYIGICTACGYEQLALWPPDAREDGRLTIRYYDCESCGASKVYVAEDLLMMTDILNPSYLENL